MKFLIATSLLLTLPALAAQEATTDSTAAAEEAPVTSEFGEPVVVNGRRISDREIKRFLIYGVGSTVLETDRLRILVDEELKHRGRIIAKEYVAANPPEKDSEDLSEAEQARLAAEVAAHVEQELARFELSDDYHKWVRDSEIATFRRRYPTLDLDVEIARAYKTLALYELQVRLTLEFDACFFPGDPAAWPEITKEAIYAGSTEVDLVQDMKESWDRRVLEAEETGQPYVRREDEMFFGLLREYVIETLGSLIVSKTAVDGLAEELVLTLEGDGWTVELETDEVYERVKPHVSDQDIRIAKRWLAIMAATEDRLDKEGQLVSLEDHYAHLRKTDEELDASMFTMDFLAVTGHGFPSTQTFRQHLRALESYRGKMTAVLAPQENGEVSPILLDYLPLANKVLGIARADAEVMLIGAFDQPTFKWKEDGWEWAKEESTRIRAMLDEHLDKLAAAEEAQRLATENGETYEADEELLSFDRYWAQVLDLHSEFWDAPMPEEGKMPPMQGLQQKGRFGSQPRNDLERSVSESSFYKILTGRSIADRVFHDMEPGDVGGPFRGPQGYYIVYLKARTAPTNPINLQTERHRSLLEEEYVRQTFGEYAQEALAQAEVSGLEDV